MKCEIDNNGVLQLFPVGGTEEFAISNWRVGGSKVVGTTAVAPVTTATLGAPLTNGAATKVLTPSQQERKNVMAQLTALNIIDYPPATRTTTLKTMLENATGGNAQDKADLAQVAATSGTAQPAGANMATAALATAAPVADPLSLEAHAVAAPVAVAPTATDVKTALMALGDVKGLEVSKQLLRDCGSENITALDPAMYSTVIAKATALRG